MSEYLTAPLRSRRAAARRHLSATVAAAPLVAAMMLLSANAPARAQLLRGLLDTNPGTGVLGTGLGMGSTDPGGGVLGTGLTVATTGTGGLLGTGVSVGSTSPGTGVLGTGVTLGTTGTGGVLGTGATVGTTAPGEGVLGTGVTLGTAGTGGVLGTGVTVGSTRPGEGVLGTGVTLGTGGTGTGGGPTGLPTPTTGPTGLPGPTTTLPDPTKVYTIDSGGGGSYGDVALRLSRLEQQVSGALQDLPLRGTDTSQGGVPRVTGRDAVAGGYGASAGGGNATAMGSGASAAGDGSVAVGSGASAAQTNAVALGAGARTTRAGQVAVGTARSTYTMAGLSSADSRAAQSGTTQFVTADAGGNLATSAYGPGSIAALDGRVSALDGRVGALESSVGRLQRDMRGAYQGTAIALALTGAVLPAGKNFAVSTSFGTYRGETGFGASGIARVTDNLFLSGGVGVATSGPSNVAGRGGVTLAW